MRSQQMVNGNQCTVTWHVDNLKISHADSRAVDDVTTTLENFYGKLASVKGRKHTYVGMDIEYCEDCGVEIIMKQYLLETIE